MTKSITKWFKEQLKNFDTDSYVKGDNFSHYYYPFSVFVEALGDDTPVDENYDFFCHGGKTEVTKEEKSFWKYHFANEGDARGLAITMSKLLTQKYPEHPNYGIMVEYMPYDDPEDSYDEDEPWEHAFYLNGYDIWNAQERAEYILEKTNIVKTTDNIKSVIYDFCEAHDFACDDAVDPEHPDKNFPWCVEAVEMDIDKNFEDVVVDGFISDEFNEDIFNMSIEDEDDVVCLAQSLSKRIGDKYPGKNVGIVVRNVDDVSRDMDYAFFKGYNIYDENDKLYYRWNYLMTPKEKKAVDAMVGCDFGEEVIGYIW